MAAIRTPRRAVSSMFFVNGAFLGIWASRIPAFVERFDLTEGILGLLLLFMGLGAIASFPLAGRGADAMGAHRLAWGLGLGYLMATLSLPLAPNLWTLGLCLMAFGAAHGAMDVAMNAFAAEVERAAGRPIMASVHAMWSLGAGFGAATGAVAAALGAGVVLHYWVAVPLIGAAGLWLAQIPWDSRRAAGGVAFAWPKGPLLLVGLVAMAAGLGEGAVTDWSAVFMRDVLGTSEAQAVTGYVAFSVVMVVMRLTGDRITGALGPALSARLAGCAALVGAIMVSFAPSPWWAVGGFAALGVGYALIVPLAFSRAANDPNVPQGRAIAAVATLGYGALLLAPPVIGAIAEATSLRVSLALLVPGAAVIVALSSALAPQGSSSASQ